MLQILSKMYDDSINEILSGERLDDEKFKTKAEENIATALENSTKEKKMIFEKKWFLRCKPLIALHCCALPTQTTIRFQVR